MRGRSGMVARYRDSERGSSLMIVLLVMMLLSALMIGFMVNIMADTRSSGVDRDETKAYAAAHAGMEKLTSDLAALFLSDYSPSGQQISDQAAKLPTMAGFTYTDPDGSSGYKVQFTAKVGGVNTLASTPSTATPVPDDPTTGTTIAAGPYQGFKGLVTHYNIMVTARSSRNCDPTATQAVFLECLRLAGGSEVRMRRELQTVAVPVFQFGLFSETSLSFHSADDYAFGGRIHTNGNLFLASGSGSTLTLSDKVTAVGEVVRRYLDNGLLSTSSYSGTVNMAKGTGVYRALSASGNGEGSVIGDIGTAQNEPTWTNLSVGSYNGYIRNGRTGAKRLDLPLVTNGAQPIDLIRRGVTGENSLVYAQRYYTQASLRILLSDTAADLTGLPGVSTTAPTSLEAGTFGGSPIATSMGSGNYKSSAGTSLIGGYIKIEKFDTTQPATAPWVDVTAEILGYGIAGRNLSSGTNNTVFTGSNGQNSTANGCLGVEPQPNAIIRIERVKDVPSTHSGATAITYRYDCASTTAGLMSSTSTDYWPLALYDTREGLRRDESAPASLYLGGVMYYIELDTSNLAKWFRAVAPYTAGTGGNAKNDNGGYIVYFSDRRNNRNTNAGATADPRFVNNAETGEYGYEDIINPGSAAGTDNGTADTGENVNGTMTTAATPVPIIETYGKLPNDGKGTAASVGTIGATAPLDSTARPTTAFSAASPTNNTNDIHVLRGNRPILFRRALKLTGGAALRTSGLQGLTIASENPVYVQGDYNSTAADASTETHIAAAIISDAISVLSNSWNDVASFVQGLSHSSMGATNTGYRFAAVMGKNISFPSSSASGWTPETNWGMDGGAHNLLRLQEDWGGDTMFYRGSIVSFYASRQAVGIFMCCVYVHPPPSTRTYNFDTDFLLPDKLPPGTPMFRDVNTLTFRQILRPNQ